jgi:hypothetical protein
MTKCSVAPRAFGTLPAGSLVREKSRFALYSASGTAARLDDLAAFVEVRLAGAFVPDRVAAPPFDALRFDELRFDALRFDALGRPVADERSPVDFVARLAAVRFAEVVFRVVAMSGSVARSMPFEAHGRCSRRRPGGCRTARETRRSEPSRARFGRSLRGARVAGVRRDRRATGGVTWGTEDDGRAGRAGHSWRGR